MLSTIAGTADIPGSFTFGKYAAPNDGEGNDLPGPARPEKRPTGEHQAQEITLASFPGSHFPLGPGEAYKTLPIQIQKFVKRNPNLKELRLSFDHVADGESVTVGRINSANEIVTFGDSIKAVIFKDGEEFNIFSQAHGINSYVSAFVNQHITREQVDEASFAKYTSEAQDRTIDPFTDEYKFIFSIPEPGVLEIHITEA
jgi:hypothetical protein